jgi:hypothetical protein
MKLPILVCLVAVVLMPLASTAEADTKPPQVTVNFIFPPSPLIQYGAARLVYEMVITNYVPLAYTLESITVDGGARQFSYSGENLKEMMRFAGESSPAARTLQISGGRTAVVFFMLEFRKASEIPESLNHTLNFRSPDGVDHALRAKALVVKRRAPLVLAAPLRGSNWIAGDSVNNSPDAAHRRAILFDKGEAYLAQRYAIDWVRCRIVNGVGTTWSGPEDKNSSYLCYDAPIYSMTSGTVTEVLNGIPENVPHSGKMAIDVNLVNAGGNHLSSISVMVFMRFTHSMRPGTIKVKVGDEVKAGDILGRVGNSGNSTEPHLHEHIVNQPSFLAGQGVPYEFERFQASGAINLVTKPHDQMYFRNIGVQKTFIDDYPASNAAVSFR